MANPSHLLCAKCCSQSVTSSLIPTITLQVHTVFIPFDLEKNEAQRGQAVCQCPSPFHGDSRDLMWDNLTL